MSEEPTVECPHCAHADAHGWWGRQLAPARSHCRDCHRSWRSRREGHCARCCRHFSDVRAFDAHFSPDACLDPNDVVYRDGHPKLADVDHGYGPVWHVVDRRTHTRPFDHPANDRHVA